MPYKYVDALLPPGRGIRRRRRCWEEATSHVYTNTLCLQGYSAAEVPQASSGLMTGSVRPSFAAICTTTTHHPLGAGGSMPPLGLGAARSQLPPHALRSHRRLVVAVVETDDEPAVGVHAVDRARKARWLAVVFKLDADTLS